MAAKKSASKAFLRSWRGRRRQFEDRFPHLLARLKLNNGALRDWNVFFWAVRVAPNSGLAHLYFKDAKIAQFHRLSGCDSVGNEVEGALDHLQHFLLNLAGFFANPDYEITLCHSI